jgi:ADP-ribose pyrophosphatase
VIELPAGLAGDVGGCEKETLSQAAQRELQEETGYECREMIQLTEGPPSSGLSSEIITFFEARGLRRTGSGGGHGGEKIIVHEVPLGQVDSWLHRITVEGILWVDPKVYTGLYFIRVRGGFFCNNF